MKLGDLFKVAVNSGLSMSAEVVIEIIDGDPGAPATSSGSSFLPLSAGVRTCEVFHDKERGRLACHGDAAAGRTVLGLRANAGSLLGVISRSRLVRRGSLVEVVAGPFKGRTGIAVELRDEDDKWVVRLDKPWNREGGGSYRELLFTSSELKVVDHLESR